MDLHELAQNYRAAIENKRLFIARVESVEFVVVKIDTGHYAAATIHHLPGNQLSVGEMVKTPVREEAVDAWLGMIRQELELYQAGVSRATA